MKKFTTKIVLILSITGGVLVMMFFVTNKIIALKTDYKIPQNVTKIIIGHSHAECAYNDTLINNFANAAKSGTSYFYNYYFLQPLINNNPNIDTVFIEFSNNQIEGRMDNWTWGDEYIVDRMGIFGAYIDVDGIELLLKNNPKGLAAGYIGLQKDQIIRIIKSNYFYLNNRGGYVRSAQNKLNEDIKVQKTPYYIQNQKLPASEMNLRYLEKCIAFLQSKNIKIYLVRSPMHKKHKGVFNEKLYQKLLHTRFKNTEFLDFKDYPLPDADFGDLHHLNYKGANKFSVWFDRRITDGFIIQQKP